MNFIKQLKAWQQFIFCLPRVPGLLQILQDYRTTKSERECKHKYARCINSYYRNMLVIRKYIIQHKCIFIHSFYKKRLQMHFSTCSLITCYLVLAVPKTFGDAAPPSRKFELLVDSKYFFVYAYLCGEGLFYRIFKEDVNLTFDDRLNFAIAVFLV